MIQPIEFDPAFAVEETSASNPDAPGPVHEHVSALGRLVQNSVDERAITDESASFLREFANRHDAGYGTNVAMLEGDDAQVVLARVMEELDTGVSVGEVTEYLNRHRDSYMVTRIIGHGVLGLVENTLAYQAKGMNSDRALGLASAMAAHHPGYPVTMVSGFLPDEARLTDRQRAAFFVDNGGADPEGMRGKLVTMAAEHLHVPVQAAGRAAIVGFALDRITPGSVPTEISIRPDGSTVITGGELLQKKFGLVAGDTMRDGLTAEMSIAAVYAKTIKALNTEVQAAITAAEFAGEQDVLPFIRTQSEAMLSKVTQTQDEALAALRSVNLGGEFHDLSAERDRLLAAALKQDSNPALHYALASYDAVLAVLNR